MLIIRRSRNLTLAVAAGAVPFLLALSLRGANTSHAAPARAADIMDAASLQTARLLDSIAQERFASAQMKAFGLSRMGPPMATRQHVNSIAAETPAEAAILERVNSTHRDYLIAFLHCAPVPNDDSRPRYASLPGLSVVFNGSRPSPPPAKQLYTSQSDASGMQPAPTSPYLTPLIVHEKSSTEAAHSDLVFGAPIAPNMASTQQALLLNHQVQKALPNLKRGHEFNQTKDGWTLLLSPVRASADSCLSCHTGAKRGDTLGVMVYAVSNTVNKN